MKGFVFVGKGGVGKTTCSAALALKLSKKGKTLVASLDPAHNLGDVYGVHLDSKPKRIKENLYAMEIDTNQLAEDYLKRTAEKIKSLHTYLKVLNLDKYIDTLKYSPGIEEYSILEGLVEIASMEYDYIVLDMPPTGLTVRVLTLPYTAMIWIEKLIEIRREILKRRRAIEKVMGKTCFIIEGREVSVPVREEEDQIMNELKEKRKMMEFLKNFFSQECSIILVVNPEELSILEGKRAAIVLKDFGLEFSRVILNKFVNENEFAKEAEKMGKTIKIPFFKESPKGLGGLERISEMIGEVFEDEG